MRSSTRILITVGVCVILFSLGSPANAGGPDVIGEWSAPIDVGVIGIHAVLLHTGQVLLFQYPMGTPYSPAKLFDPITQAVTDVRTPFQRNVFCSGVSVLADGRVLVDGGEWLGTSDAEIFDPSTSTWSVESNMSYNRFYPSNVEMPDGTNLVFSGSDQKILVPQVEKVDPNTSSWTTLPDSADLQSEIYPRTLLLADGDVFRSGPEQATYKFDPSANTWSFVANMSQNREQGAAILLSDLHTVLTAGGAATDGGLSTPTAETIDLSGSTPAWTQTGSMTYPRSYLNLVTLPDGTVLAVGGATSGRHLKPTRTAELFDPVAGQWTLMAQQIAQRTYHSTALLLPDGRVLSAGSDQGGTLERTVEIYSPPYLFRGARPTIASAPSTLTYGQSFSIRTPDAENISRVELIRPGSATHSVNFDQREIPLAFTQGAGTITATITANAAEAPPGYYMLFIVDSGGVPAVAPFVLLS